MNRIEIDTKDLEPPSWLSDLESFAVGVLRALDIKNMEISLLLTGDQQIRELNRDYRGIDAPTDVLSFCQIEGDMPMPVSEEGTVYAGDIIISMDSLASNAEYFQVDREEEMKRLTIHGILHLAGYDHETNDAEEPMLQVQEQLVRSFSGVKLF